MNIYPAILTESFSIAEEQVAQVVHLDTIHTVQIDIIDGEFVDNLTISAIDLIGTNFENLSIDFHLMVIEPVDFIYECRQIENVRNVIGQIERMSSQLEFIDEVKRQGMQAGLSLDLYTPVESIHKNSWEKLHFINIMGNVAGHQGEPFKGQMVLDKIKEVVAIKKQRNLVNLEVAVDIGVNEDTIGQIAKAGATGVSVGSLLWKSDSIEAQIERLLSASV